MDILRQVFYAATTVILGSKQLKQFVVQDLGVGGEAGEEVAVLGGSRGGLGGKETEVDQCGDHILCVNTRCACKRMNAMKREGRKIRTCEGIDVPLSR